MRDRSFPCGSLVTEVADSDGVLREYAFIVSRGSNPRPVPGVDYSEWYTAIIPSTHDTCQLIRTVFRTAHSSRIA